MNHSLFFFRDSEEEARKRRFLNIILGQMRKRNPTHTVLGELLNIINVIKHVSGIICLYSVCLSLSTKC